MKLTVRTLQMRLANPWKIASGTGSGAHGTIIVELSDADGVQAIGEAAPSATYDETVDDVLKIFPRVDTTRLSFADVRGSTDYLRSIPNVPDALVCALNTALMDGVAKRAGKALCDFLGLGFREHHHVTSFSIGIDTPEIVRRKVLAAEQYPILKLKVGDARDRENFAALREVAPDKPVRVDANEGWRNKEEALRKLEWLTGACQKIEFVEQPMPRDAKIEDLVWLKERSPLPLFADESCHTVDDIPRCAEGFHGVNVKLVKTGGVSMAYDTLQAARKAGLKTMIGCMIETSVLISAAAHLAELADFLDVDGNLLITNDPYLGVTAEYGMLSFVHAREKLGLRVCARG